jgi:hypothetical protein
MHQRCRISKPLRTAVADANGRTPRRDVEPATHADSVRRAPIDRDIQEHPASTCQYRQARTSSSSESSSDAVKRWRRHNPSFAQSTIVVGRVFRACPATPELRRVSGAAIRVHHHWGTL